MLKDVFISHSRKDSEIAQKFCDLLEERGISCWIAPRDVLPGENFLKAINNAIEATRATVLIFSENSKESIYVTNEIVLAVDKGKTIYNVKIRNISLSKELEVLIAASQWVEAWKPPIEQKADELARAIRALLEKQPPPLSSSAPLSPLLLPQKWKRYAVAVAILTAVLLLIWLKGKTFLISTEQLVSQTQDVNTPVSASQNDKDWNMPVPVKTNIVPRKGTYAFKSQGCFKIVEDNKGGPKFLIFSRDCYRNDKIVVNNGAFSHEWGEIDGTHCPTDAYAISGAFVTSTRAEGLIKFGYACQITDQESFVAEFETSQ